MERARHRNVRGYGKREPVASGLKTPPLAVRLGGDTPPDHRAYAVIALLNRYLLIMRKWCPASGPEGYTFRNRLVYPKVFRPKDGAPVTP